MAPIDPESLLAPDDVRMRKRTRILQTARSALAARGFEATRMEEIAKEAGVSKGTLYNFFESKEELLVEAVLLSYEEDQDLAGSIIESEGSPLEILESLIEYLATIYGRVSEQTLLAHHAWSVVLRSPEAKRTLFTRLDAVYRGYTELLVGTFEAGMKDGTFRRELDPGLLALTWIATFDGLVYRSGFSGDFLPGFAEPDTVRKALGLQLERILTAPPNEDSRS